MSDNKKYYYLKLKENFFDREEIKVIKGMDKGDSYVCIMLEMYLRSLKRDGLLMMTDRIPYNLQTLSSVLGRPQDEIKYAIELFTEFKLIDVLATGEMYMSDIQNFIGQSSTEGDRKREYRRSIDQQKLGQTSGQMSTTPSKNGSNSKNGQMSGQMSDEQPPEIELELEKEIEIKREIEKGRSARAYGRYQNVFLTDEELADLQASFPTVWGQYIEKLSEYMASTGKRYQSHAATIRRWAGEDAKKAAPPTRNRDYSVKEDETV